MISLSEYPILSSCFEDKMRTSKIILLCLSGRKNYNRLLVHFLVVEYIRKTQKLIATSEVVGRRTSASTKLKTAVSRNNWVHLHVHVYRIRISIPSEGALPVYV